MINKIDEIVNLYLEKYIPAIENGEVEVTEQVIQDFLKIMHIIFGCTGFSSEDAEKDIQDKLKLYYENGYYSNIVDMMYTFMRTANCFLYLSKEVKYYASRNYETQCRMSHLLNNEKVNSWIRVHDYQEKEHFVGKGVVYSAITGTYDLINEDFEMDPCFDYILFTDNHEIKSQKWKVVYLDNDEKLDQVRLARKVKILGYRYLQGYDYSIWVDGKIRIVGELHDFVQKYKGRMPILAFCHYINTCVYQEYELCNELKKDNQEVMKRQIEGYREEGYPENQGMIDSCILVRELNDEKLNQVMDCWWQEVHTKSLRDQLSFNYSFWKMDFAYDTSSLFCGRNQYFLTVPHNMKRN